MVLAEKLWSNREYVGAWNFGPNNSDIATVREVISIASESWGNGGVKFVEEPNYHETRRLSLDISKSTQLLNIRPKWTTKGAVLRTVLWYKNLFQGDDAGRLCDADISFWEADA